MHHAAAQPRLGLRRLPGHAVAGHSLVAVASSEVELIRAQTEALNRGDLEASVRGLDPEIEWVIAREHPAARTLPALDELRAYRDDWLESMPGMRVQYDEFVEGGDLVIATGRVVATGVGSDAEVSVPIGFVFRFRDGRVVSVQEFLDPEEALGTT